MQNARLREHASSISRGIRERASGRLRVDVGQRVPPLDALWIQHFWRNLVAIFSNSLLHTALDFVNGMIAEDTNPKEEPIADEVGRAEA